MFDLKGKVAIVTGSSRGIGRAAVEELARAGARVVVSSRKAEAIEPVAAAIRAAGGEAVAIPCNVGRDEELQALVDGTRRAFGRIDVVVGNAAVNPYFGPLAQLQRDAFDKIMATNVWSNLTLARLVLPEMAERRDGAVIFISSIAGLKGTQALGAYAVSKAADFQLARSLAVEWGRHNVRINCIAPGLVRTDFARALWENEKVLSATLRQCPLGRIGEPDDIAGAVVFLASDAAKFMTGQVMVIDGGVTLGATN
ncbi:MAG: SDR family oxidoreductase [Alphaproteobacteria bacterium]|nr:SDR family oxidoreductase [Alphaproteobacteria bacterium]